MFRQMRRKRQLLSLEETIVVLKRGKTGVLALSGDDGYPYAVPINYFYDEVANKIYMHCAKTGHKVDAVKNYDKASFCVVDQDEIVPEKYTTKYCSVIVFGKIGIVEDEIARKDILDRLTDKYAPGDNERRLQEINKFLPATCILELTIEHMTGKIGLELLHEKNN